MANTKTWHSELLTTLKIRLDQLNPRSDIKPEATQEEIRLILLEEEDVSTLAHEIIKTKGLLKGERIITVKERGGYTVLEGNRRVCACQMLLNRKLVPQQWTDRFPFLDSDTLRTALEKMEADIAPNRDAAEVTLTKRHTEPGVRPWSPMAKQRRIVRLLEAGRSLEGIIEDTGSSRSTVIKAIRDHNLLKYIRRLDCWKPEEIEFLNNPKLKPTAFTRFFSLKNAKEGIGLSFNEKNEILTTLDNDTFNQALEVLARELLLPDPSTGKTTSNTRTTPDELYERKFKNHKNLQGLIKRSGSTGKTATRGSDSASTGTNPPAPSPNTPKPAVSPKKILFFEELSCPLTKEQRLVKLANEISKINYRYYPIAATFLVRALLESTLSYCLRHKKQYDPFILEYKKDFPSAKTREPGFAYMLDYCIKNEAKIFQPGVGRLLNHWRSASKDFCDIVIHGHWLNPTDKKLIEIAGTTRHFIERVFDGTAFN